MGWDSEVWGTRLRKSRTPEQLTVVLKGLIWFQIIPEGNSRGETDGLISLLPEVIVGGALKVRGPVTSQN